MATLKDLLETAYQFGMNAGIIEAAHKCDMMEGYEIITFDEFCTIPYIKELLKIDFVYPDKVN